MAEKRKTKIKYKSIFRRVLLVFLGLLLGTSVYFVNAQSITRNKLPMPFGTGVAVVLSGSMEPKLKLGDLLIVRKADVYHENDVVVYQSQNTLIVHRIQSIDGETCVTKGDANLSEDPPITVDAIQGVVVARIPFVGTVFNVLRTPLGIIIILLLAVLLIESSFSKEKRIDDEEREAIKQEICRLKEQQEKDKEE